ncbi:WD40 repeat domain-containing protein [Rhizobium ruizarguesonis]|uniref:WD40 repeat domain-containing protein n=1 Tax=Rhizobium ruizarguesonis TaxID=2081791 RepID=UPI0013EE7AC5|nr:hypothetical protein [Rhizobium ruizarguesonis]
MKEFHQHPLSYSALSDYELKHLATHLAISEHWVFLQTLLTDFFYFDTKCQHGLTLSLITDLEIALASNKLHPATLQTFTSLRYVLSRNVDHILQHPNNLFPVIWNALLEIGDAAKESHETMPAFQAGATTLDLQEHRSQFLAERWHADYSLVCSDRVWAKSVGSSLDRSWQDKRTVIRGAKARFSDNFAISFVRNTIAAGTGQELCEWNLNTGALQSTYVGHTANVTSVRYSDDGTLIVSCALDGTINVWSTNDGLKRMAISIDPNRVRAAILSRDNRMLIIKTDDSTISLWDMDATLVLRISMPQRMNSGSANIGSDWLSVSSDGALIFSADEIGTIYCWRASTGQEISRLRGHSGSIACGVLSRRDSNLLVTSSRDRTIRFWSVDKFAEIHSVTDKGAVGACALSEDSEICAYINGKSAKLIRCSDYEEIAYIRLPDFGYWIEFLPSGRHIAVLLLDGSIEVIPFEIGNPKADEAQLSDYATALAFSPVGPYLAVGYGGGRIEIWDLRSEKPIAELTGMETAVKAICWSGDGQYLGASSNELVFNSFGISGRHDRWVDHPVSHHFNIDCGYVASLRVWQFGSRGLVLDLKKNGTHFGPIGLSPDGKRIAVGCDETRIEIYDAIPNSRFHSFTPEIVIEHRHWALTGIAFSPDGELLACGADLREDKVEPRYGISIWYVGTHAVERQLRYSVTPDGLVDPPADPSFGLGLLRIQCGSSPIHILEFSRSTARVAAAPASWLIQSNEGVQLWDLNSGSLLSTSDAVTDPLAVLAGARYYLVPRPHETVIWDSQEHREVGWLPMQMTSDCFRMDPSGTFWATVGSDGFGLYKVIAPPPPPAHEQ